MPTNITFTRVDTPPLNDADFSYQIENWLSTLVDTINYDLETIENSFVRATVTLAAGSVTVMTSQVNTGDTIFFSLITPVNPGFLSYSIVDGVSFTITSTSGTDASTLSYMITKI